MNLFIVCSRDLRCVRLSTHLTWRWYIALGYSCLSLRRYIRLVSHPPALYNGYCPVFRFQFSLPTGYYLSHLVGPPFHESVRCSALPGQNGSANARISSPDYPPVIGGRCSLTGAASISFSLFATPIPSRGHYYDILKLHSILNFAAKCS